MFIFERVVPRCGCTASRCEEMCSGANRSSSDANVFCSDAKGIDARGSAPDSYVCDFSTRMRVLFARKHTLCINARMLFTPIVLSRRNVSVIVLGPAVLC